MPASEWSGRNYHIILADDGLTWSVDFRMPNGARFRHAITNAEVESWGGRDALIWWANRVDAEIIGWRRPARRRLTFAELMNSYAQPISAPLPPLTEESVDDASTRIAEWSQTTRRVVRNEYAAYLTQRESEVAAALESGVSLTYQGGVPVMLEGATFVAELPAVGPNAGLTPEPEPVTYLGMRVVRTGNVSRGTVVIENRVLYVSNRDTPEVWQERARARVAVLNGRRANVSIKAVCRLCGKAYPSVQGIGEPDRFCSDRCRATAKDLIDCEVCNGTGMHSNGRDKCGSCWGTTFKACDACGEDHAHLSHSFLTVRGNGTYFVCPACVKEEREVATAAPAGAM